jgi:DNA invertase Pin-like site-specific DNA recombinase
MEKAPKHEEKSVTGKTVAYLRVSKLEQDLEKNKMDILKLANEEQLGQVHFVEEKVSGKVSWRKRKIADIVDNAQPGDNLLVSELSRLGRSMLECIEILSVATEKGLHIYAVKGNWRLDGSIQSKIIAMAFAIAAEIERDLISQRTTEALQARKQKGLPLGRPKGRGKSKLDPHREKIEVFLKHGSSFTWIANEYETTVGNLKHWMKQHGIKREKK